jgi:hypothetical protein
MRSAHKYLQFYLVLKVNDMVFFFVKEKKVNGPRTLLELIACMLRHYYCKKGGRVVDS